MRFFELIVSRKTIGKFPENNRDISRKQIGTFPKNKTAIWKNKDTLELKHSNSNNKPRAFPGCASLPCKSPLRRKPLRKPRAFPGCASLQAAQVSRAGARSVPSTRCHPHRTSLKLTLLMLVLPAAHAGIPRKRRGRGRTAGGSTRNEAANRSHERVGEHKLNRGNLGVGAGRNVHHHGRDAPEQRHVGVAVQRRVRVARGGLTAAACSAACSAAWRPLRPCKALHMAAALGHMPLRRMRV